MAEKEYNLVQAIRNCASDTHGCEICPYRSYTLNLCLNGLMSDAADAIEQLSKRETPMPLRITTSTRRCPSCNRQVSGRNNSHSYYRFCRWCGQALDWTEPSNEG